LSRAARTAVVLQMIAGLRRLAQIMAVIAGAGLIATAFLVSAEVVLRKLFAVSLNAGAELSSYMLGIASTWGFGYTLLLRGHVRVDALVRLLPLGLVAWIDLLALSGLGAAALIVLWQGWGTLAASWSLNSHSMTPLVVPLWIPQGLWVAGLAFFLVVILALAVRAIRLLIAGRFREARQLIGTPEIEEEAVEAIAEAREAMDPSESGSPR
jgi:TRAP-type mannitol/chloroaromatic compound transport system permease small subunit